MINIELLIIFRLVTRYGYIFRKSTSKDHIKGFFLFSMGLIPLRNKLVRMLLNLNYHNFWEYIQFLMWNYCDHIFLHYWTSLNFLNIFMLQNWIHPLLHHYNVIMSLKSCWNLWEIKKFHYIGWFELVNSHIRANG